MALAIGFKLPQGLVLAAERRVAASAPRGGSIRLYDMRVPKIVHTGSTGVQAGGAAFAVVPTGRACFRDDPADGVYRFLAESMAAMGTMDPADIAPELADRIMGRMGDWDCMSMAFLMAGMSPREGPFLSAFTPKEKRPWESLIEGRYGTLAIGPHEAVDGILKGWEGSRTSYDGCEMQYGIALAGIAMSAACESYRHKSGPVVGGIVDVFAMANTADGLWTGWYYPDGAHDSPIERIGK